MKVTVLVILATVAPAQVKSSPGLGGTRFSPPYINRVPLPKSRFRRSPDTEPEGSILAMFRGGNVGIQGSLPLPQGALSATWEKSFTDLERRPSYNLEYQHNVFDNDHGSVRAMTNVEKSPGQEWVPNVGIEGSLPLLLGTLSATLEKSITGLERRPSYNIKYQHKIFENEHGSVDAMVGAVKFPGEQWQPYGGFGGTFRFPRSGEPQEEVAW